MQNIDEKTARKDFIRGYVMNATGGQTEFPMFAASVPGYGSEWKKEIKSRYVAQARVWIAGGEMLAQKNNFVELDPKVKDHWGIPVLRIHFTHCENDRKLIADFHEKAEELFRKAGGEMMSGLGRGGPAGFPGGPGSPDTPANRLSVPRQHPLNGVIHEVGTARMSDSSKEGVLNSFCQTHDIPNLYIFGGNAFPSTGDKHPTLTMMALTARGCDHLIEQSKGRIS
jgi:choline dehydrogenase-like flavoprotein